MTLDGLLITGRGIKVTGELTEVKIRHCTLVPGWMREDDHRSQKSAAPSLRLTNTTARLSIESSILGSILINQDEVRTDPLSVSITDSILDATDPEKKALDASGCPVAFAKLTVLRSTIYGETLVHAIDLAENSIFFGKVTVCRRQKGACASAISGQSPGPLDDITASQTSWSRQQKRRYALLPGRPALLWPCLSGRAEGRDKSGKTARGRPGYSPVQQHPLRQARLLPAGRFLCRRDKTGSRRPVGDGSLPRPLSAPEGGEPARPSRRVYAGRNRCRHNICELLGGET